MKQLLSTTILLAIFAGLFSQPEFDIQVLDRWGTALAQTSMVDMDKDGDLDIAVFQAWHHGKTGVWYENHGDKTFTRHDIGTGDSDVGGDAKDLDGDGYPELWSGTLLFKNNLNGTFSTTATGAQRNHDAVFIEEGDEVYGYMNSDQYGLVRYRVPADPFQIWEEEMISPISEFKIHGGIAPGGIGDLDGDGDHDIVTAKAWYEQDGGRWIWRPEILFLGEDHKYGIAVRSVLKDLDGDGDLDLVQAECDNPDSRIAWFENNGCAHWEEHEIKGKGDFQDFHTLIVDNFDNDPELEIVSGGGPMSLAPNVYLWDPQANGTYKEYILQENAPSHEAVCGDLDGDGDLDFYTKPWADGTDFDIGTHYIYWNEAETDPTPPDTGWVSMFDGQTLDGWHTTGGDHSFYVEGGAIVGESVQGVTQNGFLVSDNTYSDFHWKAKVRLVDADLNSGVMFRADVSQDPTTLWITNSWMGFPVNLPAGRMYGYQFEVAKEASGYVWDEARRGEVAEFWPGTDNGTFVIGDWNDIEIICEGPKITTKLNGVERISFNDGLTLAGAFGLQVHGRMTGGMKVMWKDIFVKGDASGGDPPIDPPDPPLPGDEEQVFGWRFNGSGEADVGGVDLIPADATKYYQAPAPEGSYYFFGEYGGHADTETEITFPKDAFSISFLAKPKPSNPNWETVKTILEIGDLTMLVVMGSIENDDGSREVNTGKVAMPIYDYTFDTPEEQERGFESYGNVILANQWNHVVMTRRNGDCDPQQDWDIIINGREVAVMGYSKTAYEWDNTGTLRVSKMLSGKYPSWDGIDDVRVFNYQLSIQEAIDIYESYEF